MVSSRAHRREVTNAQSTGSFEERDEVRPAGARCRHDRRPRAGPGPGGEAGALPSSPPPPSLPSIGVAVEVEPQEKKPGTYEARAILTDALTGRRLSQSWVAVKVGSFADMRARVTPESGGGVPVDMYMKISIGEDEDHATLTTSYRKGARLILKQETTLALGVPRPDR